MVRSLQRRNSFTDRFRPRPVSRQASATASLTEKQFEWGVVLVIGLILAADLYLFT